MIAPASTGRESRSRIAVIFTDHTNRGIEDRSTLDRSFFAVVIKLIEARMELAPARWREKITISTEGPEWARLLDRGG